VGVGSPAYMESDWSQFERLELTTDLLLTQDWNRVK
jgi:hypothetical protein